MPEPLLTTYLSRLTLAGFRPRTIEARGQVLTAFAAVLAPRHLLSATREDAEAFLSRPLAPESRRTYRSHLRAFYGWCVDEEHITTDPTARIPAIRVKRGTPRPIPDADVLRALDLADARMQSWLLLMCLAGLRCLEVSALRPDDLLDTASGTVLFLRDTKGGGTATVPAHPQVVAALGALPIRSGRWWQVNPATLSSQVNRHLRSAGVVGTAHALRHTSATLWYEASGRDLLLTSELMRHASVNATQIYAKLNPTRPAEVVGRVHLRAV